MYNNPAFQMFLMATVDRYWIKAPPEKRGWETGTDKMLIVSVGTGTSAGANYSLKPEEMHLAAEFGAKLRPVGANQYSKGVDNTKSDVNTLRPSGNSNAYALRRLRNHAPAIHERVLAGELTPHAGMIEAGFRKKRPSKKPSPLEVALRAYHKLTPAEREEFERTKGI
jgi:hypothetical protein